MPEEPEPRTYFITFGTYGARLHGDARGSVNRWHNQYGESPVDPNPSLQAHERGLMKSEPFILGPEMRGAVDEAIRERCRFMGWKLWTLNVRTNHVHVVVTAPEPPEKVMTSFKARATSLIRLRGLVGPEERVWARHGSTRRLASERDLEDVILYVSEGQGPDLRRA